MKPLIIMKQYQLPLKTFLKSIVFILSVFIANCVYSQITPTGFYTPGGLLDTVIDGQGIKYSLGQIATNDSFRAAATGRMSYTSISSCSPGYFKVYLEAGCGMDDATDTNDVARLNVFCQVLTDISNFIPSPCTGTGQKVNIWVTSPIISGTVLGTGSPYYNIPYDRSVSGIADNAIWITLNSGTDAFTNVASPLTSSGGTGSSGTTFFHGSIHFNWAGFNWNYSLTSPPGVGQIDFYTVALHEMMHAMGFGTLIDYNGNSVLGSDYPYFTRYDTHLRTPGGTFLINSSTGCDLYNSVFNPSLDTFGILSPGGCRSYDGGALTDYTYCPSRIVYSGTTPSDSVPVYTPLCFERGSSISHFEDMCYVPTSFAAAHPGLTSFNNQYYVLSNAACVGPYDALLNPGAMKRALTPEERLVLCDIGYQVKDTFGNAVNYNLASYPGGVCSGFNVAGINDGLTTSGTFSFATTRGTPIDINPPTMPIKQLLNNDFGADSFKCLKVVIGMGTFSRTSGNRYTSVYYYPDTSTFGVQLLSYIP